MISKLISASIILSFIITILTTLIPYNAQCSFFISFPCGLLTGYPMPIFKELCINDCISKITFTNWTEIKWEKVDNYPGYILIDIIFWLPISFIIILTTNKYFMQKSKK